MKPTFSYWEKETFLKRYDYVIVGSGIVGLFAALKLRDAHPNASIAILEKGILPEGASTKNAGFACFGSSSELLDDLNTSNEEAVIELVSKRKEGLNLLRKTLGDSAINYEPFGGYEVFLEKDESLFNTCLMRLDYLNELLHPVFKGAVFSKVIDRFNFSNTKEYLIYNQFEGQLHTGKMMQALLQKVQAAGVVIFTKQNVTNYHESGSHVSISTDDFELECHKLLFATNAFASQLLPVAVTPGRAQVLVTKPIPNLDIKGSFHLDRGYFYFRNIENRILFGGGRNLAFEGETTTDFGTTNQIQNQLKTYLESVILPNTRFEIDYSWSGIMGLGAEKRPIVQQLTERTYCGVRLGGMGVAIGSLVGTELAALV
ncbi:FAD-dependent oxidoreductase [Flavobacterium sp.]|uniref:NAD(P)/FAD-dependent oxidoreductase n=1 Tax=Flavobacterium sp. TaxID=239 RepID=UPI00260EA675|nr:FAD-dependent oxidoreductase [Flavobacterium sp.]